MTKHPDESAVGTRSRPIRAKGYRVNIRVGRQAPAKAGKRRAAG